MRGRPRKKKNKFDPNKAYVAAAIKFYTKNGGKITNIDQEVLAATPVNYQGMSVTIMDTDGDWAL